MKKWLTILFIKLAGTFSTGSLAKESHKWKTDEVTSAASAAKYTCDGAAANQPLPFGTTPAGTNQKINLQP